MIKQTILSIGLLLSTAAAMAVTIDANLTVTENAETRTVHKVIHGDKGVYQVNENGLFFEAVVVERTEAGVTLQSSVYTIDAEGKKELISEQLCLVAEYGKAARITLGEKTQDGRKSLSLEVVVTQE